MNNAARNILLLLALGSSTLASQGAAAQQNVAQQNAAPSLQASPEDAKKPAAAPNSLVADTSQPMSLADMARLARAKKKDEPKATKVIDDENMPRGGVYIGGSAPGSNSSSPSAKSGEKLVLLDFWASWCGPCRESLPDLKRFQSAFNSDQVEVISIDEDRDERTWNAFVAKNQMNWEQRFDTGGESARHYGVSGFPTYILIDSKGTVLQRYEGEDPQQSLVDRIGLDVKKAQEAKSAS